MRFFDSSAALGVWYTIQTILQWILVFDLGIGNGLRNRLVPALVEGDGRKVSFCVSSAYRLLGMVCLVLLVVVASAAICVPWNVVFNVSDDVLPAHSLKVCMLVVGCGVVLQMFFQLINGILYALQLSAVVNALSLVSNTLILCLISLFPSANDGSNIVSLSIANVAFMVLPLVATTIVVLLRRLLGCRIDFKDFSWKYAKESLSTGLVILFLQLTWVVVASTHSLLISLFRDPSEVVEFQIYYKVYYTLGSLAAIALVPIWSAVSMAQAKGNFAWIVKTYKECLLLSCAVAAVCVMTAPLLQLGFNIWLGDESIGVNMGYVAVMSLFAVMFVLQNVNASIGNGLSYFRVQVVCMGLGAVAMVPLAYLFSILFDSWIGVIVATIVAITPFQIVEPFACVRYLKRREANTLQD